jgi:hypothetical protein
MDPPRKFRLRFQNHPPTRSRTRIRAGIEPSVELLPAKSGQSLAPEGVVGRSANRLMALSTAGAYWISSIRSGRRRSAAKRAGSRCARPRVTRSSRLTICRVGSAQLQGRELLPTCRGPRNSQTGNSRSDSVGRHRFPSWVLRNPMFGNIAMHCIFAEMLPSLPTKRERPRSFGPST